MDHTRRGGDGNCATPDLKQEHTADPHKSANSKTSDDADMMAAVFARVYIPDGLNAISRLVWFVGRAAGIMYKVSRDTLDTRVLLTLDW